jgi:hypothetical protein
MPIIQESIGQRSREVDGEIISPNFKAVLVLPQSIALLLLLLVLLVVLLLVLALVLVLVLLLLGKEVGAAKKQQLHCLIEWKETAKGEREAKTVLVENNSCGRPFQLVLPRHRVVDQLCKTVQD